MAYNDLQETDTVIVNSGENSYSATVEQVAAGTAPGRQLMYILVNRGENSYSVTVQQLSDEIGARGEISATCCCKNTASMAQVWLMEKSPLLLKELLVLLRRTQLKVLGIKMRFGVTILLALMVHLILLPTNAFDGNLTTLCGTTSHPAVSMTFTKTFTGVSKLRVYQDQNILYDFSVNGGPAVKASDLGASINKSWVDLTSLVPANGVVNTITNTLGGQPSNGLNWSAVEVNGILLVDTGVDNSGAGTITVNTASLTYTTDNNLEPAC